MAKNLEAQDRLRGDRQLLPTAINEFLRYDSPTQALARTVVQDVELHGQQLKAGDPVALVWSLGNRDEDVFPDADQCVLDRKPNRHIAFGYGIHYCIGAELGRLEISVVLDELLTSTERFELDGEVVRTVWPSNGVSSLPLRIAPS